MMKDPQNMFFTITVYFCILKNVSEAKLKKTTKTILLSWAVINKMNGCGNSWNFFYLNYRLSD